jgi:ATP synthase protein I
MTDEHRRPMESREIDPAARRGKRAFDALAASAVGLEFGVAVLVGAFFGHWLDGKAGTEPWLMLAFIVLGFVAGVINVVRGVRRAERAMEHHDE